MEKEKKKQPLGHTITRKVQNTQQAFCCSQQSAANAQYHFTLTLYLQVCSLHPAYVIEGSRHAFGQGEEKMGQATLVRVCFFFPRFVPGKRSVAEPDKPRTESVT